MLIEAVMAVFPFWFQGLVGGKIAEVYAIPFLPALYISPGFASAKHVRVLGAVPRRFEIGGNVNVFPAGELSLDPSNSLSRLVHCQETQGFHVSIGKHGGVSFWVWRN
jgi:hypothetical protein